MSDFKIKLADKIIEISSVHKYIQEYCREYISTDAPDFSIQITQEDIDFEREKSRQEDIKENIQIRSFSDDYLETLAVYRKIAGKMLDYDTILFHGSVIAVDNTGYLFTAKSGTGKSTHTRLWRELFGKRAVMVNDDKPLIKITKKEVKAYGTPWDGKHRLSTNISVPLNAICILTRSEENFIEEISLKDAYHIILQQTYRPEKKSDMIRSLELIDLLMKNMKFYRLGCNISIEAAKMAYNGMNGVGL